MGAVSSLIGQCVGDRFPVQIFNSDHHSRAESIREISDLQSEKTVIVQLVRLTSNQRKGIVVSVISESCDCSSQQVSFDFFFSGFDR